jgi:CubicO group peptidase (beta-lactamase class C family)
MNYFLNIGERPQLPSAPREAFYHLGAGNNVVYVDPVNDLVIVMRWISSMGAADGVISRVLGGLRESQEG